MAAVLASGEGAGLSYRSAGMLWAVRRTERGLIEVTSPRAGRPLPGVQRHRAELPGDEVTVQQGIPITTVARTLLDLATVLNPTQLARAVNEAEVQRLWEPLSLNALLERYPRRRGVPALRALLGQRATVTRGELEKRFLEFLEDAGLPLPETNAHVQIDGIFYEVDCLWRAERVIVELDGRQVHDTRGVRDRPGPRPHPPGRGLPRRPDHMAAAARVARRCGSGPASAAATRRYQSGLSTKPTSAAMPTIAALSASSTTSRSTYRATSSAPSPAASHGQPPRRQGGRVDEQRQPADAERQQPARIDRVGSIEDCGRRVDRIREVIAAVHRRAHGTTTPSTVPSSASSGCTLLHQPIQGQQHRERQQPAGQQKR